MSTLGKAYLGNTLVANNTGLTMSIEENGEYDVTNYRMASVNVAGSGERTGIGPYIKNPINGIINIDLTSGNFTYDYEIDGGIAPFESYAFYPESSGFGFSSFPNTIKNIRLYGIDTASVSVVQDKLRLTLTPSYTDEGEGTVDWSVNCAIMFSDGGTTSSGISNVNCGDVFLAIVKSWAPAICFVEDTQISLADGTTKAIQDITFEDNLLVWDFDNGVLSQSKPLWISRAVHIARYNKVELSNGVVLKLVGSNGKCHRLFNVDRGQFVYAIDMVGEHTIDKDGNILKVVRCEIVEEPVDYYNIITDYHMNLYAGGVLTSCRYSNLYPVQDVRLSSAMRYIKDERPIVPFEAFEGKIDRIYYDGLRLGEQTIPVEETIKYIERLEVLKK